jgi:hypothetical protein
MRIGDRLEDLEVIGKIALKWNFENCDKMGVGWIYLAEDRPVAGTCDVVMTFGLHKMRGIYWQNNDLLFSQEGLRPTQLFS